MRGFLSLLFFFLSYGGFSQKIKFAVKEIPLPAEISYYNNQFSGLYIHQKKLFLLSESRLQDNADAKLYAVNTDDLDRKMNDSTFTLPYRKFSIYFLDSLRKKMAAAGDDYEGLEALLIRENIVYLSVETSTASANCYLLKGILSDSAVILDPAFLISMPKPLLPGGSHVYNAGFEALAPVANTICAFFEFNYFEKENYVRWMDDWSFLKSGKAHWLPIDKLAFRITDITQTAKNNFTAIHYFYKGDGDDSVYRVPRSDKKNDSKIRDSSGYHNYCRLINIKYNARNARFTWQPLWEMPANYMAYNWEGIAAYKNGYFLVNDKYTPARPYKTVLIYLKKE